MINIVLTKQLGPTAITRLATVVQDFERVGRKLLNGLREVRGLVTEQTEALVHIATDIRREPGAVIRHVKGIIEDVFRLRLLEGLGRGLQRWIHADVPGDAMRRFFGADAAMQPTRPGE